MEGEEEAEEEEEPELTEEEAEEGEAEAEPMTYDEFLVSGFKDEGEKEVAQTLIEFIKERQAQEGITDEQLGLTPLDYDMKLTDEHFLTLQQMWKSDTEDYPDYIDELEDPEEQLEKMVEWVKTKLPKKYAFEGFKHYSELEKKHDQFRKENPFYADLDDKLRGADIPKSYASGQFLPSQRGFEKELDRLESLIGRYPLGFRHYENYYNYITKYPNAT